MREIGSYEAKTHLPRLLDDVARGESLTITKHGRPVARLIPVDTSNHPNVAEVIAGIRRARKGVTLGVPLRDLIEEGRR